MTAHQQKGVFIILIASLILSLQGISIKLLYQEQVGIVAGLLLRGILFVPVFLVWKWCRHGRSLYGAHSFWQAFFVMLAGVLGYYFLPLLSMESLRYIGTNIQGVLLYSYPVIVVLIMHIMQRSLPTWREVALFIIVELGVYLVMTSGQAASGALALSDDIIKGGLLALLTAFIFAIYILLAQRFIAKLGGEYFQFYAIAGAFLAVVVHFFGFYPLIDLQVSIKGYAYSMLYGFASFVPIIMFISSISRIGGARTAMVSTLVPCFTVVFAAIILDEFMSAVQLFGSVMVVIAIIFLEKEAFKDFIRWIKPSNMKR